MQEDSRSNCVGYGTENIACSVATNGDAQDGGSRVGGKGKMKNAIVCLVVLVLVATVVGLISCRSGVRRGAYVSPISGILVVYTKGADGADQMARAKLEDCTCGISGYAKSYAFSNGVLICDGDKYKYNADKMTLTLTDNSNIIYSYDAAITNELM